MLKHISSRKSTSTKQEL